MPLHVTSGTGVIWQDKMLSTLCNEGHRISNQLLSSCLDAILPISAFF